MRVQKIIKLAEVYRRNIRKEICAMKLTSNLVKNRQAFMERFDNNKDYVVKDFMCCNISATVIYLRGLINAMQLTEFVILPMQRCSKLPKKNVEEHIKNNIITYPELSENNYVLSIANLITQGQACLLLDGYDKAIMIPVDQVPERGVAEPPTSAVMYGPRAGFTENIKTNISSIRRILKTPRLISTKVDIGRLTKTHVQVMYLDNVADMDIVNKIINRLKLINIDGIIDAYYIAQFLEERPHSMFKQVGVSEKPDVVCAKMLEGRIAILVDGSPIVMTLPFILIEDMQSPDDYYSQPMRVTFTRVIRIISIMLTIFMPALYIAFELYHYKAIPLRFLVTILNATQGLPFNAFIEILIVIILFEVLYEASLRMPKYLGLAMSVVGALILGDTAVKAGIISPPTVMIVAVSGIAIYTIPDQAAQLSLLRFFMVIAGGFLGFYGIMLVSVFVLLYLSDFDNYGAPYLAPLAPKIVQDRKDLIFKTDIIDNKLRPFSIPNKNRKRAR